MTRSRAELADLARHHAIAARGTDLIVMRTTTPRSIDCYAAAHSAWASRRATAKMAAMTE